ncbi:MAG: ExeA family protein [Verrucomicrobiota bacterium]
MSKKGMALLNLKYNPFGPEVPASALSGSDQIDHFCWRIENLSHQGGFALITGQPGSGKSSVLRILHQQLQNAAEIRIAILSRPQASVADFYRELGDHFGVTLTASNRWGGAKLLRQGWRNIIESSLYRPVLLIDEGQSMSPAVLNELRLLASEDLDSRLILTVVLAGDDRLVKKLQTEELLPVTSRIRCRLRCGPMEVQQLREGLEHHLEMAGNPNLMTSDVINSLCEQAGGNFRTLMVSANELLDYALRKELDLIDDQVFFNVICDHPKQPGRRGRS